MAKQLNVSMNFMANTSQAKKQLQDLQNQLLNIGKATSFEGFDKLNKDIIEGQQNALKLSAALATATNPKTGRLDLTRFNDSLKQSGTSLKDYATSLQKLGPVGQQSFEAVAQAITNAEVPAFRLNSLFSELWTTMKNTARWQFTSGALHKFVGQVETAYHYAQDLNKSLNNIRIVTEYNTDQMAKFAEQANKAAKALSTTTVDYTNASLIYYQQGLTDAEVQQRTNVTIKMANVTRQSVEEVSNQLTAIWNNFYDGTTALEHYADVLTALGAATASSSEEISTGLEKFAAVAETVGLSYEYAATALATVTAETRQSAEVVGTAFRTLFARIQDLELGNTLEDGVTLGKYAEALQTIGVNVLDANGGLKDMNDILDEMGKRWKNIDDATKVAVAQAVGGTRQYAQLIALMDNWDTFQSNLTIAKTADGSLQEQQDIYAEGWEAALKRVQAAAESIYSDIIDDDFFIKLADGLTDILKLVDQLIDSMGGLPGLLSAISAIVFKLAGPQISESFRNIAFNIKTIVGAQNHTTTRQDAYKLLGQTNIIDTSTEGGKLRVQYYEQMAKLNDLIEEKQAETNGVQGVYINLLRESLQTKQKEIQNEIKLQEEKKKNLQLSVEELKAERDKLLNKQEQLKLDAEARTKSQADKAQRKFDTTVGGFSTIYNQRFFDNSAGNAKAESARIQQARNKILKQAQEAALQEINIEELLTASDNEGNRAAIREAIKGYGGNRVNYSALTQFGSWDRNNLRSFYNTTARTERTQELALQIAKDPTKPVQTGDINQINKLIQAYKELELAKRKASNVDISDDKEYQKNQQEIANLEAEINKLTNGIKEADEAINKSGSDMDNSFKAAEKGVLGASKASADWSVRLTSVAQAASSVAFTLNSILGLVDTLKNLDLSAYEKFTSSLMSLSFVAPNLFGYFQKASKFISSFGEEANKNVASLAEFADLVFGTESDLASVVGGHFQEVLGILNDTNSEQERFNALTKLLGSEQKANLVLTNAQKISQGQLNALTAKDVALQKAKLALQTAGQFILQPQVLALIAIVGLIAIIVGTIKAIEKAQNALNEKLAEAKQKYKELNEASAEAANTVKDLKDNWEKITESNKNLDQLTKGTTEWKQQVLELNQAVLDLIDKYPQLARYLEVGENGLLNFDEKGYSAILDEQIAKSQELALAATNQAFEVAKINNQVEEKKRREEYEKFASDNLGINEDSAKFMLQSLESGAIKRNENGDFYTGDGKGAQSTLVQAMNENKDVILALTEKIQNDIKSRENAEKNLLNNAFFKANEEYFSNLSHINTAAYETFFGKQQTISEEQARANEETRLKSLTNAELRNEYISLFGGHLEKGKLVTASGKTISSNEEIRVAIESVTVPQIAYTINEETLKEWEQQIAEIEESIIKNLPADMALSRSALDNLVAGILADPTADNYTVEYTEPEKTSPVDEEELKNLGLNADEVSFQMQQLQEEYNLTEEAAYNLAVQNQRLNKGVETLSSNWENWSDVLQNSDKTSYEYAKTASEVTEAIKNLVGAVEDFELPKGFLESEDNLKLLDGAAKGVQKDIDLLGVSVAKSAIEMSEFSKEVFQAELASQELSESDQVAFADKFAENFEANKQTVLNGIADLQKAIEDSTIGIGDSLTEIGGVLGENWVESLNEMAKATGMSVEQMNSLLNELGVKTEVNVEHVETKVRVPKYRYEMSNVKRNLLGQITSYEMQTIPLGSDEVDGVIDVPQINSGDNIGKTPDVTYIGNGNVSNSSVKSSGGGSSKSSKSAGEEIDRYHYTRKILGNIEDELNRVGKAQDRAFGTDKLKAMNEQISLYNTQLKAQEGYLNEISNYLNKDRAAIEAYGATFDSMGNITNYDALMSRQINTFNASLSDAAEESYNNFKDALSQYEETLSLFQSENDKYQDIVNELASARLTRLKYSIELQINVKDDTLQYIEFLLGRVQDNAFKTAESLDLLGQKADNNLAKLQTYQKGLRDILSNKNMSDSDITSILEGNFEALDKYKFTEEEIDTIREYKQNILDISGELLEIRDAINESVIKAFDGWIEKIDRTNSAFEHLTNITNSYKNIVGILGRARTGIGDEVIRSLNNTVTKNEIARLEASRQAFLAVQNSYAEAKNALDEAYARGIQDDINKWEETVNHIEDQMNDMEESFLSNWESTLNQITEAFQESMEMAAQAFKNAAVDSYSFESVQDQYNKTKDSREQYLDDLEKQIELSSLLRKVNQDLTKSNNLKNQEALRDLYDEIAGYQEQGIQMTQKDLEYLQKRYDLRVAELALEAAQNDMTTMRLRRNSEGGWSYVYTANQSKIDDATDAAEKKLLELRDFNNSWIDESSSKILETINAIATEITAIDPTLSAEDRMTEQERIINHYRQSLVYNFNNITKALQNNGVLLEDFGDKYAYLLADNGFYSTFSDTILGEALGTFETETDFMQIVFDNLDKFIKKSNEEAQGLEDSFAQIGSGYSDGVLQYLDDVQKKIQDETAGLAEEAKTQTDGLKADLEDIIDKVEDWQVANSTAIQAQIDGLEELVTAYDRLIAKLSEVIALEEKHHSIDTSASNVVSNIDSVGGYSIGSQDTKKPDIPSKQTPVSSPTYEDIKAAMDKGREQMRQKVAELTNKTTDLVRQTADNIVKLNSAVFGNSIFGKKVPFDTGGYTGDWGNASGRLAVLHRKELVLNADDTQNFLNGISILRDITKSIDLSAALLQTDTRLGSIGTIQSQNQTIEQQVHITAEFPNAVDHTEIEQAFDNLIGLASQYAGRKE